MWKKFWKLWHYVKVKYWNKIVNLLMKSICSVGEWKLKSENGKLFFLTSVIKVIKKIIFIQNLWDFSVLIQSLLDNVLSISYFINFNSSIQNKQLKVSEIKKKKFEKLLYAIFSRCKTNFVAV